MTVTHPYGIYYRQGACKLQSHLIAMKWRRNTSSREVHLDTQNTNQMSERQIATTKMN